MQTAIGILYNALHQRQGVSQVLRRRIRRLQDFDIGELLLIGSLIGINGRRRVGDVHGLEEFLQMVQGETDLIRSLLQIYGSVEYEETRALCVDQVMAGLGELEKESPRDVRVSNRGRRRWSEAQLHSRKGDGETVFIDDSSRDFDLSSRDAGRTQRQHGNPISGEEPAPHLSSAGKDSTFIVQTKSPDRVYVAAIGVLTLEG